MDKKLEHLEKVLRNAHADASAPEGEVISVSDTVSKAASVYEAIRNTLEYDEEHRLRRNAIRRILKRRLGAQEDLDLIAQELLHELIWARYFPNKAIPESMIGEVSDVLRKYRPLFGSLAKMQDVNKVHEWLLDMVASEIGYLLVPPVEEDAMANFAYHTLKERIKWDSKALEEKDRDMQLYLAVHRALLRSNPAVLRYRIFILFYPNWHNTSPELIKEIAGNLDRVYNSIEQTVKHPASESLYRLVRRYTFMFNVLRDVIVKKPKEASRLLSDPEALDKAMANAAKDRYKSFHIKLRRSVVRAVVFLFITKMFLALIIELPYDLFILQTSNFVPLATNVLFFPLLLGFLGMTVTLPKKKNTALLKKYLRTIVFQEGEISIVYRTKKAWRRSTIGKIFDYLYLAMFLVSYGVIAYFLHMIHFNALSIAIFLFFLSLVLFFGVRLRMSRRDLLVVERAGGIISSLFDFFFLPIIRAGRWMALRAPRINVFLFFLDYIVEAPFKMAIQLVEGWLAFMREKKEEIE